MIALFPLQVVVYPGEKLPLHIFEKRYQQLIKDCEEGTMSFGIPACVDKNLEYGTEVLLRKVAKRYKSGESDVICVGVRVFRILDFHKRFPGKLYAGGTVEFLVDDDNSEDLEGLQKELLKLVKELYKVLGITKSPAFNAPLMSYQVAHKVGLTLLQEYYLLKIRSELKRLIFLIEHLKITIPVAKEMNRVKEVVNMNGHFRNYDPLDFENYEL